MAGEEAQRLIAAASHAEEHNTHGELTVGLGDPVTSSLREFPRTGSDGDAAAFSLPCALVFRILSRLLQRTCYMLDCSMMPWRVKQNRSADSLSATLKSRFVSVRLSVFPIAIVDWNTSRPG